MKKYNVTNRSTGIVVVNIPEIALRREFQPGETKVMTYDELMKLKYQAGGQSLLANFLYVQNAEDIIVNAEPEYFMSKEDIIKLIKTGSLDEFLDCLDFAPVGILDLIKELALSVPLTDTEKIQALKDKTGFDVLQAQVNNMNFNRTDASTPTERRVKHDDEVQKPARRSYVNKK